MLWQFFGRNVYETMFQLNLYSQRESKRQLYWRDVVSISSNSKLIKSSCKSLPELYAFDHHHCFSDSSARNILWRNMKRLHKSKAPEIKLLSEGILTLQFYTLFFIWFPNCYQKQGSASNHIIVWFMGRFGHALVNSNPQGPLIASWSN